MEAVRLIRAGTASKLVSYSLSAEAQSLITKGTL